METFGNKKNTKKHKILQLSFIHIINGNKFVQTLKIFVIEKPKIPIWKRLEIKKHKKTQNTKHKTQKHKTQNTKNTKHKTQNTKHKKHKIIIRLQI